MTWTTADMLAELDRQGFDVEGWTPDLSRLVVLQMQVFLITMQHQAALIECAIARRMEDDERCDRAARAAAHRQGQLERLVELWSTLWPDVREERAEA